MIKHEAKKPKINRIERSHEMVPTRGEPVKSAANLQEHIDVAALAQLYNSPPSSHLVREELLEDARGALLQYELAEDEMEIAAQALARTLHMLVEQHGGKQLEPHHMEEVTRHVLDWCGICHR